MKNLRPIHHLRPAPALLMAALLAAPAMAKQPDRSCHFDRECLQGEACAATDFNISISWPDEYSFRITSDAESIDGLFLNDAGPETPITFMGTSQGAVHMITIAPDGKALYTAHMQGPFAATYLGQCEEAN